MSVRKNSLRSVLDVAVSLVMVAAASTLIYKNVFATPDAANTELDVPAEPVSIAGAQLRGRGDAKAVMIVYSDFQCPFCRRFAREVLPEIERRYVATGQVALAFRHLPLPIHAQATRAAVMAECAGRQDRFWQMHDALFDQQGLDDKTLLMMPALVELDTEKFDACLLEQTVAAGVEASAGEAKVLNVRATPSFFFGTRLDNARVKVLRAMSGARPVSDFSEHLDGVLAGKPTRRFSLAALLGFD